MDAQLKGLFGGGADADTHVAKAQDLFDKVTSGKHAEINQDDAKAQLNTLLGKANSGQVERATKAALGNLNDDQKKEFGAFVNQLKQRNPSASGNAASSGGSFDINDISKMFGQAGGSANSLEDMFGGLLGGGTPGTTGRATGGGGGGIMGTITSMLGGLLGGGRSRTANTNVQASGGDMGNVLGGMLGSSAGKVVVGGLAAYLMKELMDGKG